MHSRHSGKLRRWQLNLFTYFQCNMKKKWNMIIKYSCDTWSCHAGQWFQRARRHYSEQHTFGCYSRIFTNQQQSNNITYFQTSRYVLLNEWWPSQCWIYNLPICNWYSAQKAVLTNTDIQTEIRANSGDITSFMLEQMHCLSIDTIYTQLFTGIARYNIQQFETLSSKLIHNIIKINSEWNGMFSRVQFTFKKTVAQASEPFIQQA